MSRLRHQLFSASTSSSESDLSDEIARGFGNGIFPIRDGDRRAVARQPTAQRFPEKALVP